MPERNRTVPTPSACTSVSRSISATVALLSAMLSAPAGASGSSVDSIAPPSVRSLDTMVVSAPRRVRETAIEVDESEKRSGRTDDLNALLREQPAVLGKPEAQSQMSVQGDSYYENRLLLRDIPLLSLAHFAGQTYSDRSFVPIGVDVDIDFHTSRIAGLFGGVSGSVTDISPRMPLCKQEMPYPEVRVNLGTLGADLSLAVPIHRWKQYYRLTWRPSDRYTLWFDNVGYGAEPRVGYSQPAFSSDIQFTGRQRAGRVVLDQLLWLSRDSYVIDLKAYAQGLGVDFDVKSRDFPWGVVSLSISDSSSTPTWKVSAGGSRQYHFEGKRLGVEIPFSTLTRDNAVIALELRPLSIGRGKLTSRLSGEFVDWEGLLERKRELEEEQRTDGSYIAPRDSVVFSDFRDGYAGDVALHLGWERWFGRIGGGVDVLGGMFIAGPKGRVDPGVWGRLVLPRSTIGIDAGVVSTQPDIRGQPTQHYAQTICHTVRSALDVSSEPWQWLRLRAVGYAKWRDHMPVRGAAAYDLRWDETVDARFAAVGASGTIGVNWREYVQVSTMIDVSRARVLVGEERDIPEWDIPWTSRTAISLSPVRNRLTFFLTGLFAEGLPSQELVSTANGLAWTDDVWRAPPTASIDAKIQYRQPIGWKERHVAQLDVYMLWRNLFEWGNVREYYWDEELVPRPVALGGRDYHVGLRATVRF